MFLNVHIVISTIMLIWIFSDIQRVERIFSVRNVIINFYLMILHSVGLLGGVGDGANNNFNYNFNSIHIYSILLKIKPKGE